MATEAILLSPEEDEGGIFNGATSAGVAKKAPTYMYTRDELLSWADLPCCRRQLDGLDPNILRVSVDSGDLSGRLAPAWGLQRAPPTKRESDAKQSQDLPEWRKDSWRSIPTGSTPPGSRRRISDDEPGSYPPHSGQRSNASGWDSSYRNGFERGVGNSHGQNFGQGAGNRWDHRGGNGERGFRPPRDIDGNDTGDYGQNDTQSRRAYKSGWNSDYGDGGSVRGGRGRDQAHETGSYARNGRASDSFHGRSAPGSKGGLYGHREAVREDVGFYDDDETFGSSLDGNEERIEQERKRRESFELMREEARRHADRKANEPQKKNLEDSIWDGGSSGTSTVNSSKAAGMRALPTGRVQRDSAISVPPGFGAPPGFEKITAQIHSQAKGPGKVESSKPVLSTRSQPGTRWGDAMELEESVRVEGISDLGSIEASAGKGMTSKDAVAGVEENSAEDDLSTEWTFESMFGPSPFLADEVSSSPRNSNSGSASVLDKLFQKADKTAVKISEGPEGDGRSKFARWFNFGEEGVGGSPPGGGSIGSVKVDSAAASATILSLLARGSECEPSSLPTFSTLSHSISAPPMPVAPSLEDIEKDMAASMGTVVGAVSSVGVKEDSCSLPQHSDAGGGSLPTEKDGFMNWLGGHPGRLSRSGQRVIVGPGINGAGATPPLPKVPAMRTVMEIESALWEESVSSSQAKDHPANPPPAVAQHPSQEEKPDLASKFLLSLLKRSHESELSDSTQAVPRIGQAIDAGRTSLLPARSAGSMHTQRLLVSGAEDDQKWESSLGHSSMTTANVTGSLAATGANIGPVSSMLGNKDPSPVEDLSAQPGQDRAKDYGDIVTEKVVAAYAHEGSGGFGRPLSKTGSDDLIGVSCGGVPGDTAGLSAQPKYQFLEDEQKASKAGKSAEQSSDLVNGRLRGHTQQAALQGELGGLSAFAKGGGSFSSTVPGLGDTASLDTGRGLAFGGKIGVRSSTASHPGGMTTISSVQQMPGGSRDSSWPSTAGDTFDVEFSSRGQGNTTLAGVGENAEDSRSKGSGIESNTSPAVFPQRESSVADSDPAIGLILDQLPASGSLAAALMLRPQATTVARPVFPSPKTSATPGTSASGHTGGEPRFAAAASFTTPPQHGPTDAHFDKIPPQGPVPSLPLPSYFHSNPKLPPGLQHQSLEQQLQSMPGGGGLHDSSEQRSIGPHVDSRPQSVNPGLGRPPFSLPPHPMMGPPPPPGGLPFHHIGAAPVGYLQAAGVMRQQAPFYPVGSPYVQQVGDQIPHMPPPDMWVQQNRGGVFRGQAGPLQHANAIQGAPMQAGPLHRPLGQMPLMGFLPNQFPPMLPGKNVDFRPPSSFPDHPVPGPNVDQWFGSGVPMDLMARIMRPPVMHGLAPPISGQQPISIEELEQKLRVASA